MSRFFRVPVSADSLRLVLVLAASIALFVGGYSATALNGFSTTACPPNDTTGDTIGDTTGDTIGDTTGEPPPEDTIGDTTGDTSGDPGSTTDTTGECVQAGTPGTGSIVFISLEQVGNQFGQIYALDADGQPTQLTNTADAYKSWPAYSPDGAKIAFQQEKAGNEDIYVIDANGQNETRLTTDPVNDVTPDWSPDGEKITFSRGGEIYVMDANGDNETQLTDSPATDIEPAFSPDGSKIAFSSDHVGPRGIFVMDSNGQNRVNMTADSAAPDRTDNSPSFSPDGETILFARHEGDGTNPTHVYVMDADLGDNQTSLGIGVEPDFSPDGAKIAFQWGGEIYVMDTDGENRVNVTNSPDVSDIQLDWGLANPDLDGDGVEDSIQTGDGVFDDGDGTTGSVTDRGGLDVTIRDEVDPQGVRIVVGDGTGEARFSVCGGFDLHLAAGSEAVVTCGSVKVEIVEGDAELVLGDGLTVVSVPEGVTAKVTENPDGTFDVENLGGGDVSVVVDGVETTVGPGQTASVTARDFRGFSAPVKNPPAVNPVKPGASLQFKWRLFEADGSPYSELTAVTLNQSALECAPGSEPAATLEPAPGTTTFQNLGGGSYQLSWKSPKTYAGQCKALRLDLGEGVTRDAYFSFTR